MVRHKVLKNRINKEAEILGEFTTRQMLEILNNYPNQDGIMGRTQYQISTSRLTNFLRANKNIGKLPKINPEDRKELNIWVWEE